MRMLSTSPWRSLEWSSPATLSMVAVVPELLRPWAGEMPPSEMGWPGLPAVGGGPQHHAQADVGGDRRGGGGGLGIMEARGLGHHIGDVAQHLVHQEST